MALSMSAEGKRVNTWTVSAVYKLCFEGLWGCKKRGLVAWKRDSPTLAPLTVFFCRLGFWEKKWILRWRFICGKLTTECSWAGMRMVFASQACAEEVGPDVTAIKGVESWGPGQEKRGERAAVSFKELSNLMWKTVESDFCCDRLTGWRVGNVSIKSKDS